jgi:phosphoglycerate dehydrogenase-like enzyme
MGTSVAELAAWADHLVVAAPATADTRHLIGSEVFAAIKPGAHLVNIARGSLIDQDALRAALEDGRVALATLDTVDPEPLPAGHWMYDHPRVRVSPHISWSAPGSIQRLFDCFLDNVRRRAEGQPLTGVVDVAAGY